MKTLVEVIGEMKYHDVDVFTIDQEIKRLESELSKYLINQEEMGSEGKQGTVRTSVFEIVG
ncbi:hypothetical protein B7C51_20245 [Paenibacillus larvae subsp. pulvifaciens]|uniref:Uncharacterized protein n=1 Tax=Paenibacillus larvae subsp. pulvifaciens TaxID=1477 RepID=A0A1V0UX44_9BACL|nr:hypothetical protein [Paenibacillus larvae]ARF69659.1 hypothetical protein B7C51_20245 [Paenibacillus larvae subsp. pulvifaciens]